MPHWRGSLSHLCFAKPLDHPGNNRKSSNERSSRSDPARDLLKSGLRLEQVLQNVQENRDVVVGWQVEKRIFEVGFKKLFVARLAQLLGEHDRVDGRPL